MVRRLLSGLLLCVLVGLPAAGQMTRQLGPGTIAEYGVPTGFEHHYDPVSDAVLVLEPNVRQYVLGTGAPGDPSQAVRELVSSLGGGGLEVSSLGGGGLEVSVEPAVVAGFSGARLELDGGTMRDLFVVVRVSDLLLAIWARTTGAIQELDAFLPQIVASVRFAKPTHPEAVVGTYQSERSSSWDTDGGVFFSEYVTLSPDGTAHSDSSIGGTTPGGTILGENPRQHGRWQVRGNRLLLFEEGQFYNYRVEAFSNGLELYTQSGDQLLWVRR